MAPRLTTNPNRRAAGNPTTPTSQEGEPASSDEVETLTDDGAGEDDSEDDDGTDEASDVVLTREETEGLSQSDIEKLKAEKVAQASYRAGKSASAREIAEQQSMHGGQVNDPKAVAVAGKEAADEVIDRARAHRGPGVYVRSQYICADDNDQRIVCPEGMKLTPTMISKISPKELKRLKREKILEDLR